MWNAKYFCQILTKFGFTQQIFIKASNNKFPEICPVGTMQIHEDGQNNQANRHLLWVGKCTQKWTVYEQQNVKHIWAQDTISSKLKWIVYKMQWT
jgi:hypothetical protein